MALHGARGRVPLAIPEVVDRPRQDGRVIEVVALNEQGLVALQRRPQVVAEQAAIHVVLAEHGGDLLVEPGVLPPAQRLAYAPHLFGGDGQPGPAAVPVDDQPCLRVVEDVELERLGCVALQEVERVAVDRPDEHLGEAEDLAVPLLDPAVHAFLELAGRLLGEGERHDVLRSDVRPAHEPRDPLRDHLRLARTRAGDDQRVAVHGVDGLDL